MIEQSRCGFQKVIRSFSSFGTAGEVLRAQSSQ